MRSKVLIWIFLRISTASSFMLFTIVIVALLLLENFQDRLESCLFNVLPGLFTESDKHEDWAMRNPEFLRVTKETALSQDSPCRRLGANSLLSELFISFSSSFGRTETRYWLWSLGSGTGIWQRCRT